MWNHCIVEYVLYLSVQCQLDLLPFLHSDGPSASWHESGVLVGVPGEGECSLGVGQEDFRTGIGGYNGGFRHWKMRSDVGGETLQKQVHSGCALSR